MVSWSIYMRDPAHFGFADILATLPPPDVHEYRIDITPTQREMMHAFQTRSGRGMFNDRVGVKERSKLSQLAKGFLYETTEAGRNAALIESNKPAFVADLARHDAADGLQVIVWTVFDAESEIIGEALESTHPSYVRQLTGSMTPEARQDVLDMFLSGKLPILISKASLIGYGLNLQCCRSMIFSGFDDSFERMYQAIRRAYRFGQKETVRVHVPYIPELEGMIFENVQAKERQFLQDVAEQEKYYREAMGL
jgi:SNF2 family DNA or RNA helicase